jgi:hypothetical protein
MSPIRLAFSLTLSAAALLAGATSAQDRPVRFTDAEYIAASRCAVLEQSARPGAAVIAPRLTAQGGSRLLAVRQRARQAEQDARDFVRHSDRQADGGPGRVGARFERECTRFVAG